MPFKSKAQRAKFGELVKQGKLPQATFDEWNKATGTTKLPERVAPKKTKSTVVRAEKHKSIASVIEYRKKKYGA